MAASLSLCKNCVNGGALLDRKCEFGLFLQCSLRYLNCLSRPQAEHRNRSEGG